MYFNIQPLFFKHLIQTDVLKDLKALKSSNKYEFFLRVFKMSLSIPSVMWNQLVTFIPQTSLLINSVTLTRIKGRAWGRGR